MSKAIPNTIRRNGVYYFKRRIPTEALCHPNFEGKEFYQVSLKTREPQEAFRRAGEEANKFDQLVQQTLGGDRAIQSTASVRLHVPSYREIQEAAEVFGSQCFQRYDPAGDPFIQNEVPNASGAIIGGFPEDRVLDAVHVLKTKVDNERTRANVETARKRLGWSFDGAEGELARKAALIAFQETELEVLDTVIRVSSGGSDSQLRSKADEWRNYRQRTFDDALLAYKATHPAASEMHKKLDVAVAAWRELVGPSSLNSVRREDVDAFVTALLKLPSRYRAWFPDVRLEEAIQRNAELQKPHATLSPKTIKDNYIGILSSLFENELQAGRIGSNPFRAFKIAGSTKTGEQRRAFKIHELNAIFQHPIFTGFANELNRNTPGELIIRDHYYWAPLIALFTGMRASEIGALLVADIYNQSAPGSPPYFHVEGTKTQSAKRDIPMHPRLLELGFSEYVEQLRERGEERLFPDWTQPAGKALSSNACIRNFNEKVLKQPGIADGLSFHCFRHTLKVEMTNLSPQLQNAILGHTQTGMDAKYFKGARMKDWYVKFWDEVAFKGLDLSQLEQAK